LGESEKKMKKLKSMFITLTPEKRLYKLDKPVIAITGGIATGKSSVTEILTSQGFKIIDADKLVKGIYQTQDSVDYVKDNIPGAYSDGGINFKTLRELFFKSPEIKKKIEDFIYPNLKEAFLKEALSMPHQDFYLYDVPLLFERGIDSKVDLIIVVYAPRETQIQRVIERDHCSPELAKKILDEQMDIEEKRTKANFIIKNQGSKKELAVEVDKLLLELMN
jgi:dephospho-CoA kinase